MVYLCMYLCIQAELFLRSTASVCLHKLQREVYETRKHEANLRRKKRTRALLTRLGMLSLQKTNAETFLHNMGKKLLRQVVLQQQYVQFLQMRGRLFKKHQQAKAMLWDTGRASLLEIPRLIEAERLAEEERLRQLSEAQRLAEEAEAEKLELLEMLARLKKRSRRNWNLVRGRMGSSLKVFNHFQTIRDKVIHGKKMRQLAHERLKKVTRAMKLVKAAQLLRKQTNTTDEDIRLKYPLKVLPPDPRQVGLRKGAFMEDISIKALIHSSDESYLPRWKPSNAISDDEEDADLLIGGAPSGVKQKHQADPLNYAFRTPIVEAQANLLDKNSSEESLQKWRSFFKSQDSNKIVGKQALMTDEVRQAAAEAQALQQDYMYLKSSRKDLSEAQHKRQDRAAEVESELLARCAAMAAGEEFPVPFRLRQARAQQKASLRDGVLKMEALPIDKPLLRQISASVSDGRAYFSVKVLAGHPLLLDLVVKRGVVDMFVSIGSLPSRIDNIWQVLDCDAQESGRILVEPSDTAYQPGKYMICIERAPNCNSKGCRFGIEASLLQGDAVDDSDAMKRAQHNLDKLKVIHAQINQFDSDDDGDGEDLDNVMQQLQADLRATGMTRAATEEEVAANAEARRAFVFNGKQFHIGDIISVPRTVRLPKKPYIPEDDVEYSSEHHAAAALLQSRLRGHLQRQRSSMTPAERKARKEAAKNQNSISYVARGKIIGKIDENAGQQGSVLVHFETAPEAILADGPDGASEKVAASLIAAHNDGKAIKAQQDVPYLSSNDTVARSYGRGRRGRRRKMNIDELDSDDDCSSEVSSMGSLPDELKERYLEFDFSDDDGNDVVPRP